jgi:hypothetical protein
MTSGVFHLSDLRGGLEPEDCEHGPRTCGTALLVIVFIFSLSKMHASNTQIHQHRNSYLHPLQENVTLAIWV